MGGEFQIFVQRNYLTHTKGGGVLIQNSLIIRGIKLLGGDSYRIFLQRYYLRYKKEGGVAVKILFEA